jgi:hypothetical protein
MKIIRISGFALALLLLSVHVFSQKILSGTTNKVPLGDPFIMLYNGRNYAYGMPMGLPLI